MPPAAVVAITPQQPQGGDGNGGSASPPAPIYVTLTAARKPFHYEASFAQLGLDISAQGLSLLVVKMGYLVPDLERMCDLNLMALTPGAVYADLVTLEYRHVARPFYPRDPEMVWVPSMTASCGWGGGDDGDGDGGPQPRL